MNFYTFKPHPAQNVGHFQHPTWLHHAPSWLYPPPQRKGLSACLSPAMHITVIELSGNFVLQSILSWRLVSFTQHFVSMLFHVSLGCPILLNSILLYECTTIYLSVFLLMDIWVISNLGLLWTNVVVHYLLFFIGIEYEVCFPHYW